MAAEADPAAALEGLLTLQDLDTSIAQLHHRRASLPERRDLADTEAALADVERRAREVDVERSELVRRQTDLESRISSAATRRHSLEQRLYAARGAPARDLQAMDEEIRQLQHRGEEMEEAELEIMVALEPLDAVLASLGADRERLSFAAGALREALAGSEAEIDAELEEQQAARASAAAGVPDDLRQRYESLRARLGGTGAARLVGNRCSGCHLELPAMEVDRIRHLSPGAVVTCEQCGRILVPAQPPGPPG
jgi:uncharacterized protein